MVLADRGFNIHDDLAVRGAKLETPAFTKGKSQLSRAKVETSGTCSDPCGAYNWAIMKEVQDSSTYATNNFDKETI